jgi:hypothetical protein
MKSKVGLHWFIAAVMLSATGALAPALTAVAPQQALPSGAEIVKRHVTALGGAAAFKKVQSIRARGRFEIGGSGIGGEFELVAARPNRMLYRLVVPGIGHIEHAFDGKVGWSLNPISGPELLTGRELREAGDDAWFDHALYEDDYVQSIAVLGRAEFDGRNAIKTRVTLRSGTEQIEYFDTESGLAIGAEAERATPQGVVPTTTILRSYQRFGGVQFPTVLIQRALGIDQVVTLSSIEADVVPETVFARPPAIAALIDQ